ncbi:LCP family protein [Nocardioides sp. R-C-SC26]|uniref:LCP family protein n=1 Tax=Nocardioides sp. R-C-SC26 TaxID=2870414 RepID=UPI001E357E99|nr:LCP family protein [Nocardioides sp. R-C-SC26]
MTPDSRPVRHPASSPTSPASERAARVRFRRALSLMAMTLIAPGTAQIAAGNAKVGRAAFRIWLGVLTVAFSVLLVVLVHREFALWLVTNTAVLGWLKLALIVGAIGWALLFLDAWRLGQPLSFGLRERRAAVGINGILCFSVAGTLLFGAHIVGVQRDFMVTMFGDGSASAANHGRFNVLLMGGDSGAGRWGLRPDSMTVASIDAETGRTVLIGLPRNMMNFPFAPGSVMAEQFPNGFDCEGCMLNGVSTWAGDNTELFGKSKNPGVDATIMAVEGITGLTMNYWAMVNLQGFKDLVDAVGGVTLTVRQSIPVGGLGSDVTGYIDPGTRKLNGFETLWYARAREGSDDYSRMARQKCVMNAMLEQISPQSALRNFSQIAKASAAMISTDLPGSEVDRFISLALKARGQKISTVSLVPPLVNTSAPDIALIQTKVAEAIDRAEGNAPKSPTTRRTKKDAAVTGGSIGSLSTGYAANQAEDLDATC